MLHAVYVRSPYAHALIRTIDTSGAKAVPGVHAVLTGADLPDHARFGRRIQDWPVLAREKVLFVGDRVAAIAAETRQAAEAAALLVQVEYKELPVVASTEDALTDAAPILHEHAEQYAYLGGTRPAVPHPNVQGQVIVAIGGRPVSTGEDVAEIVGEQLRPGQTVRFTVVRNGRRLAFPVRLGARKP